MNGIVSSPTGMPDDQIRLLMLSTKFSKDSMGAGVAASPPEPRRCKG